MRGDLLGKDCWEVFPELLGTVFDEALHAALREQKPVRFEAYSPRSDSWLEVHAYPSADGLSIYSRDITDRRVSDEQQAYHASLLNHVDDGVIATDAEDFRITAWNRGAERLYGFTAAEVLGRPARARSARGRQLHQGRRQRDRRRGRAIARDRTNGGGSRGRAGPHRAGSA
jgi:PAS domain S-box-containing protein